MQLTQHMKCERDNRVRYLGYDSELWAQIVQANQCNVDAVYDNLTGRRFNDAKQT